MSISTELYDIIRNTHLSVLDEDGDDYDVLLVSSDGNLYVELPGGLEWARVHAGDLIISVDDRVNVVRRLQQLAEDGVMCLQVAK